MSDQHNIKHQRLEVILGSFSRVVVAYSGGVDSVFLLKAAIDCLGGRNVLACIGQRETLARSELKEALEIAEQLGAVVETVRTYEAANPDYKANTAKRCYYCAIELYRLLDEIARERDFDAVLCGVNADDADDFRPGLKAVQEYKIRCPLEEAGLTKTDIRVLSKQMALPTWNKPSQPCLASRVAYGLEITPGKLQQIEKGEAFLQEMGLRDLRVRHHGNLARIEVPADKITVLAADDHRGEIVEFFKKLGFTYVSLDLQGFRSGSANEAL